MNPDEDTLPETGVAAAPIGSASSRFAALLMEAIDRCVRGDIPPDEIWLGPDALALFRLHMDEMWDHAHLKPVINYHSDGVARYRGMTLRFMCKDGLRVGHTCEPNGEAD